MRELNRDYRNKDTTTDVLAFSQREESATPATPATPGTEHLLGDIIISVEQAARQAKRGVPTELLTLACHGLCHLLGYDHHSDQEEAAMNNRCCGLLAEANRRGPTRPA